MASKADVELTTEVNPATGKEQDCVYVTCCDSENCIGPVWGHGVNSIRRALALLSEDCDCGESYHTASEGEDKE